MFQCGAWAQNSFEFMGENIPAKVNVIKTKLFIN